MASFPGRLSASLVLLTAGMAIAQPDAGTAGGVVARFDGHRVVRVRVQTMRDMRTVLALTDDVWSHRVEVGGDVDARVTPDQLAGLQASGLPFSVMIQDVQAAIDAEAAAVRQRRMLDDPQWYENYHTYDEIKAYCQALAAAHPQRAQYVVLGNSLQGQEIFGLRISSGAAGAHPGILYHAAQHAREWATPPTAVYLAEKLLTDYGTSPNVTHLVDSVEFFIVPVSNPDGYVYSWTNNRLWRKNRSVNTGSTCRGVDLNRNWGHQFGGPGSSGSACNDTFRGPSAFSEPETQVLRDFVVARPTIVAHHDIHSYSQLVMSPWGYTSTQVPSPDWEFFAGLTERMSDAIYAVYGFEYQHGPINPLLYPASGTSVDWMYGAQSLKSVTTEVRDRGQTGFLLPAEQILPNVIENYFAELELAITMSPMPPACYANCDQSTVAPVLNVADFTCFLQRYAADDPYANCDQSTAPPVLNVSDFTCFLQAFAGGCP